MLGAELRACGVDLSFTPVLDLDHGALGVIGDRAFHRDPRVATLLAKSLMHGLLRAGMANCGKHFPGHGFVKADSHVAVPVDRRSLKAILADDARPYEWLSHHAGQRDAGARGLPEGRCTAGRLLAALAEGDPARPARLHRRDLQRRPQHGRRAPPRRARRAELCRGGRAWRWTPAATWCCCATRASTAAQAVDALLDGLAARPARGHWQPDPDSEQRRLALLPASPPLTWDALMHDPAYQHALERLP